CRIGQVTTIGLAHVASQAAGIVLPATAFEENGPAHADPAPPLPLGAPRRLPLSADIIGSGPFLYYHFNGKCRIVQVIEIVIPGGHLTTHLITEVDEIPLEPDAQERFVDDPRSVPVGVKDGKSVDFGVTEDGVVVFPLGDFKVTAFA